VNALPPGLPSGYGYIKAPSAGVHPGRTAARAALLLAVALVLREIILRRVPEVLHPVAPWLFLLGMGATGLLMQRRLLNTVSPRWALPFHPPDGSRGREYAIRLLIAAIPAASGFAYVTATQPLSTAAGTGSRLGVALSGIVLYAVATPLVEEYYFRHLVHEEFLLLFRAPLLVAFASGVWFAAVHGPAAMPVALVMGTCCTLLRIRSGGLGWPVVAHGAANLLLVLIQP
jgi:uncharacterized protein